MAVRRTAYKFRLEPTAAQRPGFVRLAGARRWAWNWALGRRTRHYADQRATLSATTLCKELTALKRQPETAWLREIDAQLLQQAVRDLDRAFRNFFARRARFPKFKSKKRDRLTFRIPQRVTVAQGRVYVPKIGWVRLRQSQAIQGCITSATFTQDRLGHWDVSLAVRQEVPDVVLPALNPAQIAGLDDGLMHLVVLSDGTRIPAPRFFRRGEQRLRRAHRHLSRCQRDSARRQRARVRVPRLYEQIANQRRDFTHKLTTRLVGTYDGLCVQDLCVRGLAKTKLAKSVQDAALGELHRQLWHKPAWAGRHFVAVDRWFPSSRLCGACGALDDGTRGDGKRSWRGRQTPGGSRPR